MSTVFLPLFPLRLVAFPGEELNLHIFEPRYKQLINECDSKGITFGIPTYLDDKVQSIGTEIKLLAIDQKYPKGELDIRTQGVGIFKIKEFFSQVENRLYTGAEVERLSFDKVGEYLKNEKIIEYLGELYEILNIRKPLPELNPEFNTYQVAHLVGFTLQQEYDLLCIQDESKRQDFMLAHLKKLLPIAKEMEELRRKVMLNGHFKNILPPEV
ncbi:MAG: LON peptidase substrate-binding domain-containing protein [Lewinellaceae bacterium]|nr:LON peptidase substrate-binding domain-containing protein [Saprospiraceae bacterium]MCB9340904.1 LON peptidase substrate-binding domain-containing protein [Lewinellaceae bacterium]